MHSHHIAHRDIKPDNLLVDFNVNFLFYISKYSIIFLFIGCIREI